MEASVRRESGRSCCGWSDLAVATVHYRMTLNMHGVFEKDEATVRERDLTELLVYYC